MAVKAKKLKSGNYRALVYHYTDLNGKRHYKSFTDKSKKECEKKACEFFFNKETPSEILLMKAKTDISKITVKDAISNYIDIKKGVLSPYTIKGYLIMIKRFHLIDELFLSDINNIILQKWIATLSETLSPKSVRNTYGLLTSALKLYDSKLVFDISLPAKVKPDLYTPDNDDIKKLLNNCKNTDLELCILLAVYGPMRRGEISALKYSDIKDNYITVSKSYVKTLSGEWTVKSPKTYDSYRTIQYPGFVIDKIMKRKKVSKDMEIITGTPDYITKHFIKLRKKVGLPYIRFHDLRHYSASILHAIGIPDKYIMQRGGWHSDYTLKRVYQDTIDAETVKINNKIDNYFSSI